MTVGVLPVEVLSAQTGIDLHVVGAARRAPVSDPSGLDPAEDRVEPILVDAEAVVVALEPFSV